jgi:taurine transport system permease protein
MSQVLDEGQAVLAPGGGGSSPKRRRRLPLRVLGIYVGSVSASIVIWGLVSTRFSPILLPSPWQTFQAAGDLIESGRLWGGIVASSYRILVGWGLGIVVGIPTGLLMGRVPTIRTLLDPFIEFFRFIPPIAFVSLAVIWFGIGEASKIVLIFYTTVFIITLNTIAGVMAVEESKLRAAACLGAGRVRTMTEVVIPASVPYMVTGARLAMGNSFLTVVAAELVAAQQGLGALIWTSRNFGRTDWVFVGIVTLGLLGYLFDRVVRILASRGLGRYGVKV